jgi:sucrose-6-phosphate hydrolase SacC (GH32 family)
VWLDWGADNYAGATWSDIPATDGRRLFIGWMSNWLYAAKAPTVEWRSAMTIPRALSLRETTAGYRLFAAPVAEIDNYVEKRDGVAARACRRACDCDRRGGASR